MRIWLLLLTLISWCQERVKAEELCLGVSPGEPASRGQLGIQQESLVYGYPSYESLESSRILLDGGCSNLLFVVPGVYFFFKDNVFRESGFGVCEHKLCPSWPHTHEKISQHKLAHSGVTVLFPQHSIPVAPWLPGFWGWQGSYQKLPALDLFWGNDFFLPRCLSDISPSCFYSLKHAEMCLALYFFSLFFSWNVCFFKHWASLLGLQPTSHAEREVVVNLCPSLPYGAPNLFLSFVLETSSTGSNFILFYFFYLWLLF